MLSHMVFDYLMEFNGQHLAFGSSYSFALFLSAENISHCLQFDRSTPEILPLKK